MANLNGAFGIVLNIIIICYISTHVNSDFEFTNIECKVSDEFCKIETCFLKSINRTYKYASVKIQLLKPINKFWAHVTFMKRLNGYKPFLYNYSVDLCKLIRNPKSANKVALFFFSLFSSYSNLNHSCPYSGFLIVEKLPISHLNYKLSKVLPIPGGDYKIVSHWIMDNFRAMDLNVYFRI
ncbi:uncharacterized protein LOC132788113 [Drosophila nasuta]|uniref:uncharacterized protein LOC132788113 n=1 Tax=Drosophila nasuta TaxID=42062 RepID=UPI00295F3C42|nr:uncharacterized protein LOC132788113 [Drosophila nasuta]